MSKLPPKHQGRFVRRRPPEGVGAASEHGPRRAGERWPIVWHGDEVSKKWRVMKADPRRTITVTATRIPSSPKMYDHTVERRSTAREWRMVENVDFPTLSSVVVCSAGVGPLFGVELLECVYIISEVFGPPGPIPKSWWEQWRECKIRPQPFRRFLQRRHDAKETERGRKESHTWVRLGEKSWRKEKSLLLLLKLF